MLSAPCLERLPISSLSKVRRCRVYWKALHLPVLPGWHKLKRYCRYVDLSQMHHSYRRSLVHRRCTGTDRSLKYHLERCLVFCHIRKQKWESAAGATISTIGISSFCTSSSSSLPPRFRCGARFGMIATGFGNRIDGLPGGSLCRP